MSESSEILLSVFKIVGVVFAIVGTAIGGSWAFGKGFGKAVSKGLTTAGQLYAAPIREVIATALEKNEELKALTQRVADLEHKDRESDEFQEDVLKKLEALKESIGSQFQQLYNTLLLHPPTTPMTFKNANQEKRD